MKKMEDAFERNVKRSLAKTRGQIYQELPLRQKAVYWILVISIFVTIGVFVFSDYFFERL